MAPTATANLENYYVAPFPQDVPTIDLPKLSIDRLLHDDEKTARELFRVLCNEGFFYLDLTTDPIGEQIIEQSQQLHDIAKDIFSTVPQHVKEEFKPGDQTKEHLDTGYKIVGKGPDGLPDKPEWVNISCHGMISEPETYYLPPWLSDHKELYASFIKNTNLIGQKMLQNLENQLHLTPGELTEKHKLTEKSGAFLRLFRYPAPKTEDLKAPHMPGHTDATSITILFNWQGGLQITPPVGRKGRRVDGEDVQRETDDWLYVKPEPGHVVINLGDNMVTLTNGVLNAGRHRVVTPPGPQSKFHRYTVLTNLRPSNNTPMRALKSDIIPPETVEQQNAETLTALQWSIRKVKAILERMQAEKH